MKRILLSMILGLFLVAASDMPAMAYTAHAQHQTAHSHVVKASATKKAKKTKKHVKHAKKAKAASSQQAPVETPVDAATSVAE